MSAPITAPLPGAVIVGAPLDADSCDDLDCESQGCTGACERFTEAELIAADLEYDRNKAAKAHQAQERSAMRLQINDKSGGYA